MRVRHKCKAANILQSTYMGTYHTYMGRSPAIRHQISALVRQVLEDKEITWITISERTGIPRETLRRRLTDHNPFTVEELQLIAESLDLAPNYFLVATGERKAS